MEKMKRIRKQAKDWEKMLARDYQAKYTLKNA